MEKLLILGAGGMVGSALLRAANEELSCSCILQPSSKDVDLINQSQTHEYIATHRPNAVIVAAAKVGGIHANSTYQADFIYNNLMIAANSIEGSYKAGVERLIFLGSTCIYPKLAEQPIKETSLLTSELEPTNEGYAVAKIAGLKMCQYYRQQHGVLYHSVMPTNLYGRGDNYHPQDAHVLPALIRRFHEAKHNKLPQVTIWGSGTPLREFLHADDAANGIIHLLELKDPPNIVNLGSGVDISIGDLARLVQATVGYQGKLCYDTTKPDGTPRKLTDITLIKNTGWNPKIPIEEGVVMAYQSFLEETASGQIRE